METEISERAAKRSLATERRPDTLDESLHALPGWFAAFQRIFGLSFLVLASAYLLGDLATLGWVPDINTPGSWGIFTGAGVVIFFLAGVAVAGIGLTCSVVFVASVKRHQWFLACVTLVGMLLFFGVEVWASLSERSTNIHATPADLAVLQALGIRGVPPISPTAVVVAVLFPLGSLYFGFVQVRRQAVTQQDLADDELEMERRIRMAELQARLAEADGHKNAVRARGMVGAVRAGVQAARVALPADPLDHTDHTDHTTNISSGKHLAVDDALDEWVDGDEQVSLDGRAGSGARRVAPNPFR